MNPEPYIESLIFCAKEPITPAQIQYCLEQELNRWIDLDEIEKFIYALLKKYDQDQFSFQIIEVAHGYQFKTKPKYASILKSLLQIEQKKLSKAALETLAIIAYRQPVTKLDIEKIRGVNSDYSVQKLLDKELIEVVGRSDKVGQPLLYGTSTQFLTYFGLSSIEELPDLPILEV